MFPPFKLTHSKNPVYIIAGIKKSRHRLMCLQQSMKILKTSDDFTTNKARIELVFRSDNGLFN